MAIVFVRSAVIPNLTLRMDRRTVRSRSDSGSGIVNCQFYADTGTEPTNTAWETFDLITIPAPFQCTGVAFAFRSNTFTALGAAYLRMDPNSGTVNCQFYSQGEPEAVTGNDEAFQIIQIPGSYLFAIQSLSTMQTAYLSMTNKNMTGWNPDHGGGLVTSKFYDSGILPAANSDEAFYICPVLNAGLG
jgi:hypothetical protein